MMRLALVSVISAAAFATFADASFAPFAEPQPAQQEKQSYYCSSFPFSLKRLPSRLLSTVFILANNR
jgi:hypothetical protein